MALIRARWCTTLFCANPTLGVVVPDVLACVDFGVAVLMGHHQAELPAGILEGAWMPIERWWQGTMDQLMHHRSGDEQGIVDRRDDEHRIGTHGFRRVHHAAQLFQRTAFLLGAIPVDL